MLGVQSHRETGGDGGLDVEKLCLCTETLRVCVCARVRVRVGVHACDASREVSELGKMKGKARSSYCG